ncbi:MAG: glycosyltransferase family 2 protein [candidate division WOR-3 bacterium]
MNGVKQSTNKKVYIILVNYNNWKDTLNCLESLLNINYNNYQLVVVDNFSSNDSFEKMLEWARGLLPPKKYIDPHAPTKIVPSRKPLNYLIYSAEEAVKGGIPNLERSTQNPIVFIKSPFNGGFSFGNNLGIKYALKKGDGQYILLLNNDTVVTPNFLKEMIQKCEIQPRIGIVGCKILSYQDPKRIVFNGGRFNLLTGRVVHLTKEINKDFSYFNFITGACMLIKPELFNAVGLLNEEFFMYCEDLEFCYKAIKAGYSLVVAHNSTIYHKVGSSSGEESSPFAVHSIVQNHLRFLSKINFPLKIITIVLFITIKLLSCIKWLLKKRPDLVKATIQGLIDWLKKDILRKLRLSLS